MSDAGPSEQSEPTDADLERVDELMERLDGDGGARPRRRGRSPIISLMVAAFGIYLLVTMWGDFRYWMQPSEPEDLGTIDTVLQDGRMPPGLDDRYVVVTGTPDVQHAARMRTKRRYVGYLRIVEAEGQFFAAVPREKEAERLTAFEGRYEGRVRRLRETRAFEWLTQFFHREEVSKVVDIPKQALVSALADGSAAAEVSVETSDGAITLRGTDRVRIVIDQPDATVQLGRTSFRRASDADAAVAALGYPSVRLERKSQGFHVYVVRIPEAEREVAERKLNDGLGVSANNANPKLGALVLPRSATYTTRVGDLSINGDALRFPVGDNTTSAGYEANGDTLTERTADSEISAPLSSARAFRVERPILVDPDAYIIEVGSTPTGQRQTALLWAVVLGVVGLNLVSPVLWWRRRAA